MKEFMVFIHQLDSAKVEKVEVIRARNRREAWKKLRKVGLRKRKF